MGKYFQMDVSQQRADIYIFGDITSYPWDESDVSSYGLSKALEGLEGVDEIKVRINSYGGEVAEGIAIYNALKNHPAKVVTECAGFACSIASVVFMAGDERVMNEASLLMIHNAWSAYAGNAEEHRKEADDLDTVTQLSKQIYLAATDLEESELTEWMDAETFIDADTALSRGFATKVIPLEPSQKSQSAMHAIAQRLTAACEPREETPEDAGEDREQAMQEEPLEQDAPQIQEHDAGEERLRMAGAYLALA